MTREEALKELDELNRAVKSGPVSEQEVLCRQEMKEAARILSVRKLNLHKSTMFPTAARRSR